MAHNRRGKHNP